MLEGKRVLFCDDSILRGTQLRDNVKFYLIMVQRGSYAHCLSAIDLWMPFHWFHFFKSDLELITRRMIKEIEGDENKNLENMQRQIRRNIRRWCK